MVETAVNVPFEANEIKEIICEELRKRLDGLCPLQGSKEYPRFQIDFQVNIRLFRSAAATDPKDTLAWGTVERGEESSGHVEELAVVGDSYESGDPNEERIARGKQLTVETRDGRGNISRRKVNVKA